MYWNASGTKLKRQWIYIFPKKGAPMAEDEFNPIPVQNWDSDKKCPKCESEKEEVSTKWKTGHETEDKDTVNGETYDVPAGFEHLLCTCKCCGFEWLMQTADADERAAAVKESAEEKEEEEEDADKPIVARGHASRIVKEGP